MKRRVLFLILAFQLLSACQKVNETDQTFIPTYPVELPSTTTPFQGQIDVSSTEFPDNTLTPPCLQPNPLEIASTVLTEFSIDVTNEPSPDAACVWKRIIAFPNSEATQRRYDNQYFMYASVNCGNQEKPLILVDKWNESGLGYPITNLLGWSVDNHYVYYYDQIIPDGCQPIGGFQQNLLRANLNDGVIQSFPITWTGGITISPDSLRIIYYDRQAVEVGIYDLEEQKEQRIGINLPNGLENWFAGNFTWSPDGTLAIFIIEKTENCFSLGSSLHRVDPQSSKITTLLEIENQTVSILRWSEMNNILISINGEQKIFDPSTGKLSTP
ncbi:MAG: hypothetical protein AAGU17_07145 [Anaerolineaceae bacterium]|jgi:hypothetical protein